MFENVRFQSAARIGVRPGFCLAIAALMAVAWLVAADVHVGAADAFAGEVDAMGAAAPLGFADIIERVKPAVVGVRVTVEDAQSADDPQQKIPPMPRFADLAYRRPINPRPSPTSPWVPGFSSPAMVTS